MNYFVDTNYFLRFLLKDNDQQFNEVEKLFLGAAEGKTELFSSTIVFFELYWVLSSYYGKNKMGLIDILRKILELEYIVFDEREDLYRSLEIFQKENVDLEDSYNLTRALRKGAGELKTFDKKLLKLYQKSLSRMRYGRGGTLVDEEIRIRSGL